jgi:hypothetical protein
MCVCIYMYIYIYHVFLCVCACAWRFVVWWDTYALTHLKTVAWCRTLKTECDIKTMAAWILIDYCIRAVSCMTFHIIIRSKVHYACNILAIQRISCMCTRITGKDLVSSCFVLRCDMQLTSWPFTKDACMRAMPRTKSKTLLATNDIHWCSTSCLV